MDNQPLPSPPSISSPITSIPQPPQSHTPKIIISLITFLLGGIAVYLWQNPQILSSLPFFPQPVSCTFEAKICPDGSSVGRVPPNCDFSPCPETTNQTETTLTETSPAPSIPSDWKTYNYENIFNFSHPKNFDQTINKYKDTNLPESENQILWLDLIQDIYKNTGQSPVITLSVFKTNTTLDSYIDKLKNKINLSIESFNNPENPYANSNQDPPKLNSIETNTIGNINVKKVIRYKGPGAPNSNLTEYYFTNLGYLYRLSANYGTFNPDFNQDGTVEKELLPQILSTFKFLDQNQADISNWKTYTNKEYGFEFKYPTKWRTEEAKNPQDTALIYIYSDKSYGNASEPINYYLFINYESSLPNYNFINKTINNLEFKVTEEIPSRSGSLSYFVKTNQSKYLSINFNPYNSKQPFEGQTENTVIFNQILSTFKFLD